VTGSDTPTGPLDVSTLRVLGRRADSHPLVRGWRFEPDEVSPRRLVVTLDPAQYPAAVESARLEVTWYDGGDYAFHYVESRRESDWQCRWDRHPKPDAPREHFHPPPDASASVTPSEIAADHHLDALFEVLDWVGERVRTLHRS
jgi:hypothetical protein